MYAPVAFLVAALVAGFTGLSYAKLAMRFPRSAGETARRIRYPPRAASMITLCAWKELAT